jgi:hypothetical protein
VYCLTEGDSLLLAAGTEDEVSAEQTSNGAVLQSTASTPEHVVFRSFVNETVLLNLETGRYFGVNPTGGTMLEQLTAGGTVSDAAARLAEQYGRPHAEIEEDLVAFCADLESRGLLELRPSDGS